MKPIAVRKLEDQQSEIYTTESKDARRRAKELRKLGFHSHVRYLGPVWSDQLRNLGYENVEVEIGTKLSEVVVFGSEIPTP